MTQFRVEQVGVRDAVPRGGRTSGRACRAGAAGSVTRLLAWVLAAVLGSPHAPATPKDGEAGDVTLYLVPHWHGAVAGKHRSWDEEQKHAADLHGQHIEALKNDPAYRFSWSQVPYLLEFIRLHPGDEEFLRESIRDGRVELVNGWYLEPDLNLPGGEAIARQGILGRRIQQEDFGESPEIAWMIDAAGASHQLPQIARKTGMRYSVVSRAGDRGRPPASDFHWISPDGTSIQVHWLSLHYDAAGTGEGMLGMTRDIETQFPRIEKLFQELGRISTAKVLLCPLGHDDSPPPPHLSHIVEEWNRVHPRRRLRIATAGEYFAALEKEIAAGLVLPEYRGEFQRAHAGFYSARMWVKQEVRSLENLLLGAETLAAVASLSGFRSPGAELHRAWVRLLLNQDRNIIWGSGDDRVFRSPGGWDVERRSAEVRRIAMSVIDAAAEHILGLSGLDPGGRHIPVLLVNPLSWERRDAVWLAIPNRLAPGAFRILGASGTEVPYQFAPRGPRQPAAPASDGMDSDRGREIVFIARVPALGYAVYYLEQGQRPARDPEEKPVEGRVMENPMWRLEISKSGALKRIAARGSGHEFLKDESNEIRMLQDPESPSAGHDTAGIPSGKAIESTRGGEARVSIRAGPVLLRAAAEASLSQAPTVIREVILYRELERIDLRTRIDWRGEGRALAARFHTTSAGRNTQAIPYGFIERPPGRYPVGQWLDLSGGRFGISLINVGLPDHDVEEGRVDLTLLRGVVNREGAGTALGKGHGTYSFRYALFPHAGTPQDAGTHRRAWELNRPIIARFGDAVARPVPLERSTLQAPESFVVTVFRRDGEAIEMRGYEATGRPGPARFWFGFRFSDPCSTDMLGRTIRTFTAVRGAFVLNLAPQEIATVRVRVSL